MVVSTWVICKRKERYYTSESLRGYYTSAVGKSVSFPSTCRSRSRNFVAGKAVYGAFFFLSIWDDS